jgi:hypothetical protein
MKLRTLLEERIHPSDLNQILVTSMAKYFPPKVWLSLKDKTHVGVGGNGVRDSGLKHTFDDVINDSDYHSIEEFVKDFNESAKKFGDAWPKLASDFKNKIYDPGKKALMLYDTFCSDEANEIKGKKAAAAISKIPYMTISGFNDSPEILMLFESHKNHEIDIDSKRYKKFSERVCMTYGHVRHDLGRVENFLNEISEEILAVIIAEWLGDSVESICYPMNNDFLKNIKYTKRPEITFQDLADWNEG